MKATSELCYSKSRGLECVAKQNEAQYEKTFNTKRERYSVAANAPISNVPNSYAVCPALKSSLFIWGERDILRDVKKVGTLVTKALSLLA